jgi:hypothetical protein
MEASWLYKTVNILYPYLVHTYVKALLHLTLKTEMCIFVCRLLEEMAAMQKCLELGGLYCVPAYGLCRFLAYRFTWIQQSFIQWKKEKRVLQAPLLQLDLKDLHFMAVHIRIRMLAALIPLEALFLTYISKYQTTHPISEV